MCRTYLVPHIPPVRLVRDLTIILPIEQLLKGLSVESSAFSASNFALHVFVMPLYIPREYVVYRFGGRLGALSGNAPRDWTISSENEAEVMRDIFELTRKEALPFLNRFNTPRDVAEYIERNVHPDSRRQDPNLAETEAYSWILAGEHQRALQAFDRLERIVSEGGPPWVQEVSQRAERVTHLLNTAPAEALRLLAEWREYTLTALKLNA